MALAKIVREIFLVLLSLGADTGASAVPGVFAKVLPYVVSVYCGFASANPNLKQANPM